jgi:hypothetical protein
VFTRPKPWFRVAPRLVVGALSLAAMLLPAPTAQADVACPLPPPANQFSTAIDNPYFPLQPGTAYTYEGEEDGNSVRDVVTVTDQTKTIDLHDGTGTFQARVVRDSVYTNGKLSEDTLDYYAQDSRGNVWYVGEYTTEYKKNGRTVDNNDGSWLAGENGALPGIIMESRPHVGDAYCQENAPQDGAEDQAKVLDTSATLTVNGQTYHDVLKTEEWSPLEDAPHDFKYYARGVGEIHENNADNSERLDLVSVRSS